VEEFAVAVVVVGRRQPFRDRFRGSSSVYDHCCSISHGVDQGEEGFESDDAAVVAREGENVTCDVDAEDALGVEVTFGVAVVA